MRRRAWLPVIVLMALGAACSDDGGDGRTAAPSVEITVSAASSLTNAFTDIADDFEAVMDVAVALNFGPSDGLAAQIQENGGIDVFASASPSWMDTVEEEPGVGGRADFARNELAIIVPTDDPAGIDAIEDLAEPGVQLVVAAEGVPAGDYAREVLANAGISDAAVANVVSNEEDVRAVVTKVASGDADAGIVYVTDVTLDVSDRVTLVEIPDEVNLIATYPIAVVAGSEHPEEAQAFIDFVLGPGREILDAYGFLPV